MLENADGKTAVNFGESGCFVDYRYTVVSIGAW